MIRHIGRRLLLAIPTLLAVFTIIFIIVRVAPGDPAAAALGDYASADAVAALRERMGLNEPLWKQYLTFLGDLARGDLGRSLITQKPVSDQIAFVLPHTLELTVAAISDRTRPRHPNRGGYRDSPQQAPRLCRPGRLAAWLSLSRRSTSASCLIYFFAVRLDSSPPSARRLFQTPAATCTTWSCPR